jgi:hypothetical protein
MREAMKGIAEWLASIDLGQYAQAFAENGIDLSVVRDLTEQDLKDLGVLLGHRRKILRAIGELEGAAVMAAPAPAEPVPHGDAERRYLTVMFCDLVGSTIDLWPPCPIPRGLRDLIRRMSQENPNWGASRRSMASR